MNPKITPQTVKEISPKAKNVDDSAPPIGVAAARLHFASPTHLTTQTIFGEFRLDGRIALVTGANGGLGLEMALVLAEQGAKVYGIDLGKTPSQDFIACASYAKNIFSSDAENRERMIYKELNVTDQEGVRALCKDIVKAEGRLDVCVAAAGVIHKSKSCLEVTIDEFQSVVNVNVNGVFITATAAAHEMVKQGIAGSIVLVASISGSITNKNLDWIAYNTSKAAVLQMARSMACELGPKGIRVNTVSPGHIRTAMTEIFLSANPSQEEKWSGMNPLGRLGKSYEIRGATAWLASDASSFCTGSDIIVSGGHHAW